MQHSSVMRFCANTILIFALPAEIWAILKTIRSKCGRWDADRFPGQPPKQELQIQNHTTDAIPLSGARL
jgi:uncharacterized SAM-binding protein YcdF (DUF218 family)